MNKILHGPIKSALGTKMKYQWKCATMSRANVNTTIKFPTKSVLKCGTTSYLLTE